MTVATFPSNPAERLALLIDDLRKAVAAHGVRGLLTAVLLALLWSRLGRMARRARLLAKRMAASAPLTTPSRPRATPRSALSKPYFRLPRGMTWLVRVVPGTASAAATLRFLLDDPAMAEAARNPAMRRLLNPLSRMLGVNPPPVKPPPTPPASASVERVPEPEHPPSEPSRADLSLGDPPAPPRPAIAKNTA